MEDPKDNNHEIEIDLSGPKYLFAQWFDNIEKKAILNGFTPLVDLAYLMAVEENYSEILPLLWRFFECDLKGPEITNDDLAGNDLENYKERFKIWFRLLQRWCGIGSQPSEHYSTPALWGRVGEIDYLPLYRRDALSVDLKRVDSDRNESDLVKLNEFKEYVKNIERSLKRDLPLPIKLFPIQAEPSLVTQKSVSSDYETFIRSLRVSYENDEQIRIQEPNKPSHPYTYKSFGFNATGKTWNMFLQILQDKDKSFNVGPAHKISGNIRKRLKNYDANLAFLKALNKKWISFIHKTFGLKAPQGFKIYEPPTKNKPGIYLFKFQVVDSNGGKTEKTYSRYTKEKLLSIIQDLRNKKRPLNTLEMDIATDTLMEIQKRGFLSKKEIETIANELTESYKGEEILKFDPYENDPERDEKFKDKQY